MPDYKQLYFALFGAMCTAIEHLDNNDSDAAKELLINATLLTEELHIETDKGL